MSNSILSSVFLLSLQVLFSFPSFPPSVTTLLHAQRRKQDPTTGDTTIILQLENTGLSGVKPQTIDAPLPLMRLSCAG